VGVASLWASRGGPQSRLVAGILLLSFRPFGVLAASIGWPSGPLLAAHPAFRGAGAVF